MFVGVDGCKTGWVAAWISDNEFGIDHFVSINELAKLKAKCTMIDIPIGLAPIGHRSCDLLAKKALGQNHARVFTGARRSLLKLYDQYGINGRAKASQVLKNGGDHGISCQLWGIVPKIAQVDDFVLSEGQIGELKECHPELVFLRLNGGVSVRQTKKSVEGRDRRKALLDINGFDLTKIDYWINDWRIGKGISADDVLDACACAIAARDFSACMPEGLAPTDSKGLPMQIWF